MKIFVSYTFALNGSTGNSNCCVAVDGPYRDLSWDEVILVQDRALKDLRNRFPEARDLVINGWQRLREDASCIPVEGGGRR